MAEEIKMKRFRIIPRSMTPKDKAKAKICTEIINGYQDKIEESIKQDSSGVLRFLYENMTLMGVPEGEWKKLVRN